MRVLAIESSCDETAAAVVGDGPTVLSNIIHSQITTHAQFGGVVPEVASREHIATIVNTCEQALAQALEPEAQALEPAASPLLEQQPISATQPAHSESPQKQSLWSNIDAIAVTSGPGLVGALLVGLQFAKGVALARRLPFIGVNHLEGHLSASLLVESPPAYPYVALLVSGGHTQLYHVRAFGEYEFLGGTRDDAAGEAFDKIAKHLGMGYPGGRVIQEAALGGDPMAIPMPRAMPNRKIAEFSFSGLKTAAMLHLKKMGRELTPQEKQDFCASVQEAIADVLTKKAVYQALRVGAKGVVLGGGVAANSRLRELLESRCLAKGLYSFAPPPPLCTDNAAMIGAAAWVRLSAGEKSSFAHPARSRWPLKELSPLKEEVPY